MSTTTHQGAVGAETMTAILTDAVEILPLVAERLAGFEDDEEDEVLCCLIDRMRTALSTPAPRTDGGMSAGEDVAKTIYDICFEPGLERGGGIVPIFEDARSWGLSAADRARKAAKAVATPAQPAGAVPDGLRALSDLQFYMDGCDAGFAKVPRQRLAEWKALLATHPAGQSAGSGAEAVQPVEFATDAELHAVLGLEEGEAPEADDLGEIRTCSGAWKRFTGWRFHEDEGLCLHRVVADLAPDSTRTGQGEAEARDKWLNWRGAVEGYEQSKQVAAKAVRQTPYTDDTTPEDIATSVCWMLGLDDLWQHVAALRAALADQGSSDSRLTGPAQAEDAETLAQAVADAIDGADGGYSIRLTGLVDGVSTYTLDLGDGEPLTFPDHESAREHALKFWSLSRARAAIAALAARPAAPEAQGAETFQARADRWLEEVTEGDPTDLPERRDRYSEESLELVQALGATREGMHQLVDYVFSRPVGEPGDEMGDTKLCLANLASWANLNMDACGEAMLARRSKPESVAKIRRKRSTRHGRGTLPGLDAPAPPASSGQGGR